MTLALSNRISSFDHRRIPLKNEDNAKQEGEREQMNREWNNIIMSFYGLISIC